MATLKVTLVEIAEQVRIFPLCFSPSTVLLFMCECHSYHYAVYSALGKILPSSKFFMKKLLITYIPVRKKELKVD